MNKGKKRKGNGNRGGKKRSGHRRGFHYNDERRDYGGSRNYYGKPFKFNMPGVGRVNITNFLVKPDGMIHFGSTVEGMKYVNDNFSYDGRRDEESYQDAIMTKIRNRRKPRPEER